MTSLRLAILHCGTLLGSGLSAVSPLSASAETARASVIVLYETGFESYEGFSAEDDLAGQGGWVGYANDLEGKEAPFGGNGVLADPRPGFTGQYAYIGYVSSNPTADFNLWRPVDLIPAIPPLPLIRFRVSFEIADSTVDAPFYDDFRWSIYNTEDHRLLSLDFDNDLREVNFILDESNPDIRPTGFTFDNGVPYDLEIDLNLQRNLWTARINGLVVVPSQPITTVGARLTFGDADAAWIIRDPRTPGDNYMVFDDYRITVEPLTDIPPTLEPIGFLTNGTFLIRILGEPGVLYRLEATTDFKNWTTVDSGQAQSPGGFIDLKDADANQFSRRSYRASSITVSP